MSTSAQAPNTASAVDSPTAMRNAGRELLSLGLMDARNHSLYLFAQIDEPAAATPAQAFPAALAQTLALSPPRWDLGYTAWFQERWIARNLQRRQGWHSDGTQTPLASVEPLADSLWGPGAAEGPARWAMALPSAHALRAYLLDTLELTLSLLEKADEDDNALYFFRLCLFAEDMASEQLVRQAQMLGLALQMPTPPALSPRAPLFLPAAQWLLGSAPGGYVPDNERAVHTVAVPAFEIDAQPVSWAQYVEFVDDGGYDRRECWSAAGWAWLQAPMPLDGHAQGRRGPRYVEQIGVASGAVLQTRFGRATRMAGGQPAMHISWWEADAFARWAGRRLPAEVEWEIAAHTATRQGWRWGDVWEWTGSTYRPYPGYQPAPSLAEDTTLWGQAKAVRGGSFATRNRLKHPKRRLGALPDRDDLFIGFRTCAI